MRAVKVGVLAAAVAAVGNLSQQIENSDGSVYNTDAATGDTVVNQE